jgi:hypothetical protein
MHPQVKLSNHQVVDTSRIRVTDSRPASQKQSEILSSVITACVYGIARLGDKNTEPDRVSYLSQRLLAAKGRSLADKTIVLKDFSVYRNNQVKLRGGVMPNATGITIAALRVAECFGDKKHEGGYDVAENPTGENIAIVNIEIAIAGRTIKSRAVEPAHDTPARFPAAHDIWSLAIEKAINRAIDRTIEQI